MDMEMVAQHEYVIRPSFDEELTVRGEINNSEMRLL